MCSRLLSAATIVTRRAETRPRGARGAAWKRGLSIDNNLSERLLRGVAITRKNFMFVGSDRGGDRAAIFYTLIESAKLNGLAPLIHRMSGIL